MKILVGLSWGVDSAVSALLLQQAGHEVHAGFMINYISDSPDCSTRMDLEVAKEVAKYLKIPFFTFDFQEEYEKRIIQKIYDGYASGITPNPDVLCNNLIKFDVFAEEAKRFGYDKIAMGHYAQIQEHTGRLMKGEDPLKDQSYFLSRITRNQLSYACFPIGHLLKQQVRDIAEKANLPNARRPDSQGLCFIGKIKMKDFLHARIPDAPGDIIDESGKKIGEHQGTHYYTIGQRKWIEIGWWPARFVTRIDPKNKIIQVWPKDGENLYYSYCEGRSWHWIDEMPKINYTYGIKTRYRQSDQNGKIFEADGEKRKIFFEVPQRAITPWQYLVIYDEKIVLGSGEIMGVMASESPISRE